MAYKSNEEFYEAYLSLVERIKDKGLVDVSQSLRKGLSYLNGLTDGWALLMNTIEDVVANNQKVMDPSDLHDIKQMLRSVKKVVYRK